MVGENSRLYSEGQILLVDQLEVFYKGKVNVSLGRQLFDCSTILAAYNLLMDWYSSF